MLSPDVILHILSFLPLEDINDDICHILDMCHLDIVKQMRNKGIDPYIAMKHEELRQLYPGMGYNVVMNIHEICQIVDIHPWGAYLRQLYLHVTKLTTHGIIWNNQHIIHIVPPGTLMLTDTQMLEILSSDANGTISIAHRLMERIAAHMRHVFIVSMDGDCYNAPNVDMASMLREFLHIEADDPVILRKEPKDIPLKEVSRILGVEVIVRTGPPPLKDVQGNVLQCTAIMRKPQNNIIRCPNNAKVHKNGHPVCGVHEKFENNTYV